MDQRTTLDGPVAAWLPRDAANNNRRLIRVRWLVGALILLMTAFSVHALNLPLSEPYLYGLGVLVLAYNGLLAVLTRRASNPDPNQTVQSIQRILFVQVNLDWLSMAVFVHLTGGITSPAIVLFIIHVMLVTMLVPGQAPYAYVLLAMAMVLIVALLENSQVLPHYVVVPGLDGDLYRNRLFIAAQVTFFSVGLFATVYLTTWIMRRLHERERQVMALLRSSHDTSSTLELSVVLEKLVRNAAEALSVPGASIRLLDPTGEKLTVAASYGLSQSYLGKGPVELSQSGLDQQVLSGTPVVIGHAAHDSLVQYPKQIAQEGFNSILAVPVLGRQPLGVLRAYSECPDRFKPKDVEFLQAFANQSAAAIENALTYQALQKAEQRRAQFIRHVTHELRAPVTGAQSLIRVLLRNMAGEITAQQKDILARLGNRMDSLLELISDLLALATSKSTDPAQKAEPLSLQPVIQSVVDRFVPLAEEKHVRLTLNMPLSSMVVHATEDGLKRILENLIGNAVKYTLEGGSVQVDVSEQSNCAQIVIVDTGIGIPGEALEKLGEEFFRAPNVRDSVITGTGLGLAIVKQFVAAFGGLIRFQSTESVGTTVTVTLPLVVANALFPTPMPPGR